jgi:STE24 endopeptidase
LTLARANNIPVSQVFEVGRLPPDEDASAQTSPGFSARHGIALNDNLLKQCTLPEIRHVMGHEMGHYVLNHTGKLIMLFGTFIFISFRVAKASFGYAVRRWGDRWGVRGIGDPAGLPLLMLIISTVLFCSRP